jgi:hypothetical protein
MCWVSYEKKNKERERASKLPRGVGRVGPKGTSLKKIKTLDLSFMGIYSSFNLTLTKERE